MMIPNGMAILSRPATMLQFLQRTRVVAFFEILNDAMGGYAINELESLTR